MITIKFKADKEYDFDKFILFLSEEIKKNNFTVSGTSKDKTVKLSFGDKSVKEYTVNAKIPDMMEYNESEYDSLLKYKSNKVGANLPHVYKGDWV